MLGRPVRLASTAALSVAATVLSITAASACCHGCGCGAGYAVAPALVEVPVVYVAPGGCCGSYRPAYRVEQGPVYAAPVAVAAPVVEAVEYTYPRAYPYVRSTYWGYGYSPRYPRTWHRRPVHLK